MRRAYILIFNDVAATRERMKDILEGMPEVLNWKYELPNSFYVISEFRADHLARRIRVGTGNKGSFMISEITANKQGWLPKESWRLINEKHLPETGGK